MSPEYLESSEYIDWVHPAVSEKALNLAIGKKSEVEIAKVCFEFVRDEIKHSWDHQLGPVTVKASEVLKHGTGFCYTKSHLLAALLRANGIPAALCYQRLTIEYDRPPFCLHGLNAVYLQNHGWIRIDARGNKTGVSAQFDPPREILAFSAENDGEADIDGLFSKPLESVVTVLNASCEIREVSDNLPDYLSSNE